MIRTIVVSIAVLASATAAAQDRENRRPEHAPFKIFDNLYYVGINFVSAYVVPTSEGLILIDATYDNNVDHVVSGIRAMGFDPADIRYILCTHWHADHFGGAERLQAMSGAVVGMMAKDWDSLRPPHAIPGDNVWRMKDGDTLTLGDTSMKFFHLPGHTLGVLGIEFTLDDNGTPRKAFMFGGTGLNFSGVEQTEMYIASTKRVMAMEGIEVNVTNHQAPGQVFKRLKKLADRKDDDPHPFVDPDGFQTYVDDLLAGAERKLEREKEKAARPK